MKKFYYSIAYLILLGVPAWMLTGAIGSEIDFRAVFFTTLVALTVGGIFDIWAVRQGKRDSFYIWEYHRDSIIGIKICGVPIEDYVFFLILTPIFIISLYEALKNVILHRTDDLLLLILSMVILIGAYIAVYRYARKTK